MNPTLSIIILIWLLISGSLSVLYGLLGSDRLSKKFGAPDVFLGMLIILLVVLWWLL